MAKNQSNVFLGFLDEAVTTKYQQSADYTTNKLGGLPNFPVSGIAVPNCPICALKRPLLLQVYAPLDNSPFHRTLFVFGCLSPSCSTQSKAWLCVRSQVMEKQREVKEKQRGHRAENTNINWCSGADDWGMDEADLDAAAEQIVLSPSLDNDPNGNIIVNDNYRQQMSEDEDEDDDESTSTSTALDQQLSQMQIDEDNANFNGNAAGAAANVPKQVDGAVGPLFGSGGRCLASAEIEREEADDLVTIDTPESPHRDLIALLKQTPALRTDSSNSLTLQSYFLFVEEEAPEQGRVSEHVRELLHEYQRRDESE